MRRIYVVLELKDASSVDLESDEDLDCLATDLLCITDGVASASVYPAFADLKADEPS